ncbi:LysR family transcriptional regulator [Saccharopolyspora erythraea NRRL 2338]|uniref:LysR-family transcriptional regulator n=2 Tax=Saccharopolyspora erythraea TaxID=1836 RepID=A4FE82_SACEN|nr:LysR family transcriptional regulator [Saccharopolyspora erythraea]EQD85178.1 LysR family transcriptional regulator [Saccharopolyspora erythraea D]PFG96084.1 LysR family transcriptional regulator [Saccharopolyspora erythraea NRRL 2338]QRK93579.1 LysR family transcriptional regulator [Saccharopolyspora erythraea]CAM02357.1 LysR-family transcriptional regulator [Saccharopolyspora erythraea NRRL 2338]
MELRQLEYFVAVAEECHFTRAAKRLHVAQSGLSASIRSLERELGARLFHRTTRNVTLTAAGHALLHEARRALCAVDSARDAVAAVRGLLRGELSIGTLQCLHVVDLPPVLAGFVTAHPGIEVRLRQGGSGDLAEQVRAGRLDLAFAVRPARCPDGVLVHSLDTEPLVLACAGDHPMAERDRVDPRELGEQPFVDFHPDWGTRDVVDRVLAETGVERRVALEVTDVHSLLELVACGLGIALVPRSFSAKNGQVRFVPLASPAPTWETVAITSDPTSTAAAALLRDVQEASRRAST